jgi:hypothetical protein
MRSNVRDTRGTLGPDHETRADGLSLGYHAGFGFLTLDSDPISLRRGAWYVGGKGAQLEKRLDP